MQTVERWMNQFMRLFPYSHQNILYLVAPELVEGGGACPV